MIAMYDVILTADNKPVAMQSNPAYRKVTITATTAESVAMQSNPAYGTVMEEKMVTQLKSETVF